MKTVGLFKKLLLFLFIVLFIGACKQRVPVTNRKQLNLVSESELITMAQAEYDKVLKSSKVLPQSDPRAQQVTRVGNRIKNAVEQYLTKKDKTDRMEGFKWQINTIDEPTVNAWCMPGGLIVVYTGILPLVANDDELAVVMGHEVAHAIARHGNERMSESMIAQGLGNTLGVLMGGPNASVGSQLFLQAYGIGSALGTLSFSRKNESEADKIGLVFAKMAGYDPNQAVSFWKKMAAQGSSGTPEFLSTHPSDERRIKDIEEFIPEIDSYIN